MLINSKINKIVDVSLGEMHCVAVNTSGEVLSWGLGMSGQLGTGDTNICFDPRYLKLLIYV